MHFPRNLAGSSHGAIKHKETSSKWPPKLGLLGGWERISQDWHPRASYCLIIPPSLPLHLPSPSVCRTAVKVCWCLSKHTGDHERLPNLYLCILSTCLTNSIHKCWNMPLWSNCDCRVLASWFVGVIPHTWHWCLTTEWVLWICQIYLLVKKAPNVRKYFSFQIFSDGYETVPAFPVYFSIESPPSPNRLTTFLQHLFESCSNALIFLLGQREWASQTEDRGYPQQRWQLRSTKVAHMIARKPTSHAQMSGCGLAMTVETVGWPFLSNSAHNVSITAVKIAL